MFYDRFVELCNIKGEKPSPILKKLGISSGNIKRWKSGSSVHFDTLNILAMYFDVPVQYFFDGSEQETELIKSGKSLKEVYNKVKANPDYIASFPKGFDKNLPSYSDYEQIADYMQIDMRYLMTPERYCQFIRLPESARLSKHNKIPVQDIVLIILSTLPESAEYKFLQVRISMVILHHLMVMGITTEQLEKTLISKQKIYELNDIGITEKEKQNYNFSDLCRISEAFNISFDCIFTGNRKRITAPKGAVI